MQPKSLILLLLALACGLVAAIGITQVISKQAHQPIPMGETVPILVAKETIPAWTPLSAQHVKLEPWPKDRVPEGAISQIESVEGRRTKTPLYPGEPLLEKKIFDKNANEHGPTVMIPKGLRVVTVKVDQVSGGSGLILPGDRVDVAVVLRPDPNKGIVEPVTQTFLQDIKVFAVNDQFHIQGVAQEEKSIQAKTVSLLVTPEQAQMILVASEAGKIQLVMRSPEEQDQARVKPIRLRDVLDFSEKTDREKEALVKDSGSSEEKDLLMERFREFLKSREKTETSTVSLSASNATGSEPTKPKAEQWSVRLLKAAQIEDVVLEKSPHGWGVASSTVYGPPPETSSHTGGSGAPGGVGARGGGPVPKIDPQKGRLPSGQSAPGLPPGVLPGGNGLPQIPAGGDPADLLYSPGETETQPSGTAPRFSDHGSDKSEPSGEDAPMNLVLPPSDES